MHKYGLFTWSRTRRPNSKELSERGWKHYFGKQFRYVKFLCETTDQKRLMAESPFSWTRKYPKTCDLAWFERAGGNKTRCSQPAFSKAWDSTKSDIDEAKAVAI